jgi:DNA-binding transcriptional LysR family regulator
MLNPGRLRVLSQVVSRGSFSAAADGLNYTQSAVSQAIARLEAETGTALVVRDRAGVRPTAAGAMLLEHAEAILAQIEAAEADLDALLGLRGGRLRMASFPSAGATLMPLAIATFRARHPDVELSLAEGEPQDIAPRLRLGEIDLALLFHFGEEEDRLVAGLHTVALLEDPLHVAIPETHRLAHKRALTLGDLRGQDWVQTSATSPCARHVVRSCVAAGFEPHVTFESDDYETVQGLVAAGVGVALVPRLALTRVRPGIVVRELAPSSPTRTVLAAALPGASAPPAAKSMLLVLSELAQRHPHAVAEVRASSPSGPSADGDTPDKRRDTDLN